MFISKTVCKKNNFKQTWRYKKVTQIFEYVHKCWYEYGISCKAFTLIRDPLLYLSRLQTNSAGPSLKWIFELNHYRFEHWQKKVLVNGVLRSLYQVWDWMCELKNAHSLAIASLVILFHFVLLIVTALAVPDFITGEFSRSNSSILD